MTYHYSHYPQYGHGWHHYYGGYGWGWYPWSVWSGWWWGGPWWGWGWGWWPSVSVGIEDNWAAAPRGSWGIVKTEVQPQETELWLDGTYIGTADDFDGYPDFLYLKPGSYKIELRLVNYLPLPVDLNINSGQFVTLDKKLTIEKGKNALDFFPPESKGTPYGRYFGADGKPYSESVASGDEDWLGAEETGNQMPRPRSHSVTASRDRARLRFSVTPEDAAIYVDDQLVGVGEDLNNSSRGVIVDAGKRTVTVSRPGFKTKTVEVQAKVGQPVDVVVDLEKAP